MTTVTAPPAVARNGLGLTALVLGLVGTISGLIPLLFALAGLLGLLAVIFGFVGRARARRGEATNPKQATWGIATGIVALALSVVGIVIVVNVGHHVTKQLDCISNAQTTAQLNACP